jgi:ketosteroid isomerase-like protein
MERARVDAWLAGYRRAWEEADTQAVLGLFTEEASYRSHPLRPAHAGHDGIAAYWTRVTGDESGVRVRFGDPIVDGDRVAVEWWTTLHEAGRPATVAGCLLLGFAADGRCQALRECWHETGELLEPPPGWGRLDLPAGRAGPWPDAAANARRWAAGYERAWRAADPEAAAALYAPEAHFVSAPFRDPHPGREGVLAYTRDAYAIEAAQDPRFGTPFAAAGAAAAVEWWATLVEEDRPATLIGISVLTFAPDGLVATARDYWFLEPGTHTPYDGWGR